MPAEDDSAASAAAAAAAADDAEDVSQTASSSDDEDGAGGGNASSPEEDLSSEEEESDSTESDSDEEFPGDAAGVRAVDDEARLRRRLAYLRRRHHRVLGRLRAENHVVRAGQRSIAAIVDQITGYKAALEQERAELEAEVVARGAEVDREVAARESLRAKIAEAESEREQLVSGIAQLEASHADALKGGEAAKQELTADNIASLQTLMDELTRIEEANAHLEKSYDSTKAAIATEKKAHTAALEQLLAEKEALEALQTNMREQKGANAALVAQIKSLKKENARLTAEGKTPSGAALGGSAPAAASGGGSAESPTAAAAAAAAAASSSSPPASPQAATAAEPAATAGAGAGAAAGTAAEDDTDPVTGSKFYAHLSTVAPSHSARVSCMTLVSVPGRSAAQQMQLWVGCVDGTIRVWSDMAAALAGGSKTMVLYDDRPAIHKGGVTDLLEVRDRERVWSVGADGTLLAWAAAPGKSSAPVKRIKIAKDVKDKSRGASRVVCGLFLLEVDQFVAVGCSDGALRLLDEGKSSKLKKELHPPSSSAGALTCGARRSGSTQLWTGTSNGMVIVWSTTTLKVIHQLSHPGPDGVDDVAGGEGVRVNAIVPVGAGGMWTCSQAGVITAWNADEGVPTHALSISAAASAAGLVSPASGKEDDDGDNGAEDGVFGGNSAADMRAGAGVALLHFRTAGHVWCASGAGTYLLDDKAVSVVERLGQASDEVHRSLLLDKKGRVWGAHNDLTLSVWNRKR